jgi:pimeloyl-ACP methyl ester carboxylesterase
MKWISNILTVIDYALTLDFVSDLYLCGHSQGGLLTMLAGAMERDRLKAILPLSPASMIPEIARHGEILGVPFDPDHIPAEVEAGKGLTLRENYIRVAQLIDVDLAIARYKGPVLIVHGTGDESVPFHYSEEVAAKYANAKLVPIPGDTHCYDLHLDQVTEAVRSFLREIR